MEKIYRTMWELKNQRKDQRNESEVKNTEHHNIGHSALHDKEAAPNNAKAVEEEPPSPKEDKVKDKGKKVFL